MTQRLPQKEIEYTEGVAVFLFAVIADIAAQLVIGVAASVGAAVTHAENFSGGDYFQLCAMILLQLAFLATPWVYFTFVKNTRPRLPYAVRPPKPALLLTLPLCVVTLFGFLLPASYFVLGLDKIGYELTEGVHLDTAGKAVLGVFVMVVLAPCIEELIFRGYLLSGLKKRFSPIAAALLSGVAFSLMHMSAEQTVYQFFLGVVCALAVMACGNLAAGICIHAGSNGIALLLDVKAIAGPVDRAVAYCTRTPVLAVLASVGFALVACVLIGLLVFAMAKLSGTKKAPGNTPPACEEEKAVREKKAKTSASTGRILYLTGIGICLVLWIFVFISAM